MTEKNEVQYVQLEASKFFTDIDFMMMDAEQRGVYCSIILCLYCNDGVIELDNTDITLLSDKTNKLATLSGCNKTGSEWLAIWSKIAHKFKITGNLLTHSKVTKELERAKSFKYAKSKAGKKGMKKRWSDNTVNNSDITKESKVKESKVINNINNTHIEGEHFLNFTLDVCKDAAVMVGLTEQQGEEFYHHFNAQGWVRSNGQKITNLQSALVTWRKNQNESFNSGQKRQNDNGAVRYESKKPALR